MMGMFDYVSCKFPLPLPEVQTLAFQTKDFDCLMDTIELRADGTLWGEDYDIEDHSDPNAESPLGRLAGMMTRANNRPKPFSDFSGVMRFYGDYGVRNANGWGTGWVEFCAHFEFGLLKRLELVEHRLPEQLPQG
jgi:hypothetical protein